MGKKCRIPTCQSDDQQGLFAFPVDMDLRNKWIEKTELISLNLQNISKEKLVQYRICFKHFPKDDLFFDEKRSKWSKLKGAVPVKDIITYELPERTRYSVTEASTSGVSLEKHPEESSLCSNTESSNIQISLKEDNAANNKISSGPELELGMVCPKHKTEADDDCCFLQHNKSIKTKKTNEVQKAIQEDVEKFKTFICEHPVPPREIVFMSGSKKDNLVKASIEMKDKRIGSLSNVIKEKDSTIKDMNDQFEKK